MNGNRGAKGSINDRLISMLYRLRYKKKKQKEEDYTISNKEKKIDYINKLNDFKETQNVNMLDEKDKSALSDVKFNVEFDINNIQPQKETIKVESKNNVEYTTPINKTTTTKKVGYVEEKQENIEYKIININLRNIENKNTELDELVNLKQEEKKTKEEVTIIKEVDKFIKDSKENLDEINNEVESIKLDLKEKKDTKELEKRYNNLKIKIEKLKKQYDTIKEKYDLSEFAIIGGIKLIDNISDYKSIANLNEIETMVRVCKNEIEKIESITIIDEKSKRVSNEIENKKEKEDTIKIKFNKYKGTIKEANDIEEKIAFEVNEQEQIVNDMYKDAIYFEKRISKEIEYIGHRKILSSILNIAGGIITLPFTGNHLFGIALGASMINKGLKEMNKKLETKEKTVIKYDYKDISEKIFNMKDKIGYINLVLTDSLNEIKKLKNNFNNVFKDYEYILPDYYEMLDKINSLEDKLINQQKKINGVDKKLDEERELNRQKLKKIEKF